MDNAFRYIEQNKGIDTEESYPYKAKVLSIVNYPKVKSTHEEDPLANNGTN